MNCSDYDDGSPKRYSWGDMSYRESRGLPPYVEPPSLNKPYDSLRKMAETRRAEQERVNHPPKYGTWIITRGKPPPFEMTPETIYQARQVGNGVSHTCDYSHNWVYFDAIRFELPKYQWVYDALNAGYTPWFGVTQKPRDIDPDSKVMLRSGTIKYAPYAIGAWYIQNRADDIIGYKRLSKEINVAQNLRPIRVNGVKPFDIPVGVTGAWRTSRNDKWETDDLGDIRDDDWSDFSDIAFVLKKYQYVYDVLDKGFIPWFGGDKPPKDWDGGEVMLRGGSRGTITVTESEPWRHYNSPDDVIGYRRKENKTVAKMTRKEAEALIAEKGAMAVLEQAGVVEPETDYERFINEYAVTFGTFSARERRLIEIALNFKK